MNAAERWNANHTVGIAVRVLLDDGREVLTRTRSEAWMLGETERTPGHTAVVLLEGRSGGYRLDRVTPLHEPPGLPAPPAPPAAPASRDSLLPDPAGTFEVREEDGDWGIFWGDRQLGELFPHRLDAQRLRDWLAASWSELEDLAIGLQRGAS